MRAMEAEKQVANYRCKLHQAFILIPFYSQLHEPTLMLCTAASRTITAGPSAVLQNFPVAHSHFSQDTLKIPAITTWCTTLPLFIAHRL